MIPNGGIQKSGKKAKFPFLWADTLLKGDTFDARPRQQEDIMSVLTMDMSSYEVERCETEASGYGDEVLSAGWVPALGLREACAEHVEMPTVPRIMDVDLFLRKMYRCQR